MVMTPDDAKLLRAGMEAAMSVALQPYSDIISKIAGPAAAELGLAWQDSVKVYRFKRRLRLLQKIKEVCEEAGIDPQPVSLKLLLPAVEYASIEEDDSLQDKWAALLANAANPSSDIGLSPAFVDVLRQLTPHEAAFLDLLSPNPTEKEKEILRDPGGAFYSDLKKEWQEASGGGNPDRIPFTFDNFVRLGLFRTITRPSSVQPGEIFISDLPQQLDIQTVIWEDQYAFTDFGRKFLIACRKPQPKPIPDSQPHEDSH